MHPLTIVLAGSLICAFATSSALAQQQKAPMGKGAAGTQVRYIDLSTEIFTDLNAEVILKERRQGNTVVSAELEVCHEVVPTSRLDRFVVPLKVQGDRLVGSTQSQERKVPVSVDLTRSVEDGTFGYEGTVRAGSYSEDVSTSENTDMSEAEFNESYGTDDQIEPSPADFTEASPQALAVKVSRASLANLMNALRDQDVRVVLSGFDLSCAILRSGQFVVQLDVDPERAAAVLAKIRSVPGVSAAGYTQSNHYWDRAVRFPSAGWRNAEGKLERDKFVSAVGGIISKALGSTVASSTWDNTTGVLSIVLKRPDDTIAGVPLSRLVTVSILPSPEGPNSTEYSLLWIESISERIEDEAAGAKLKFLTSDDDEAEPAGSDILAEAVASVLKGQLWDNEEEDWQ